MPNRITNTQPAATMRILLCLLPCSLLTACLTGPKKCDEHPSNPATETFAPALGVNLSQMIQTAIGDYEQDLVVGTGNHLSALSLVDIHYSAYLVDGTLIDQVTDQVFTLDLATRATIGLADGMLGMNEGGQRVIVAPSPLALGACDNGPVPGNSTIVYKVELLAIH
jgi:FKBP-type peptidyl-prolyl cis-trans isomerase